MQKNIDYSKNQEDSLAQIKVDINKYLLNFKKESQGIGALAEKTQLSRKTIKRYILGNTRPTYYSILKLYRIFLSTDSDAQTIQSLPISIKKDFNTQSKIFCGDDDREIIDQLHQLLKKDNVSKGIYSLIHTGTVSREKIAFEYGNYGLKVLNQLLEIGAAKESSPNFYEASDTRARFDIELIKLYGLHLIQNNFHIEKDFTPGEQFASIRFKSVNKKTYRQILNIQHEAFQKKLKLIQSKDSTGPIRMWWFSAIDTIDKNLIDEERGCELNPTTSNQRNIQ